MTTWFAVHTQSCREAAAERHLANQGFATYLPRYLKTRRHARRVEQVAAPLFPRYLFVAIDLGAQRWRSINGTVGVLGIVRAGEQPLPVSGAVIAAIRAREAEDGLIHLASPGFRSGQSVRITDGPMADIEALFEAMADDQRAILLVNLLGRAVRVRVPVPQIAAA